MPRRKTPKRKGALVEDLDVRDESLEKIFTEAMQADEARVSAASHWSEVQCPYCGEEFEIRVDPSEEGQEMVQDCQVCCKPIQLSVEVEEGEVLVTAYRS